MSAFRVYTEDELGVDGYPLAWHETIKHLVREEAGHRCVRCGHPYRQGEHGNGEWSPCDVLCTHRGPVRWRSGIRPEDGWHSRDRGNDDLRVSDVELMLLGREIEAIEAQWRILTVHHLTGSWGNEKNAKRDCRWFNLCALCQRCHLQIQGKVQMARVWPWEHSPWMKPYAAGFYAVTYLGEDLSREETLARLDELLALERVA